MQESVRLSVRYQLVSSTEEELHESLGRVRLVTRRYRTVGRKDSLNDSQSDCAR